MSNGLRDWNSIDEVYAFVYAPLIDNTPYVADWRIGFGTLLDFWWASMDIKKRVEKENKGKTLNSQGTRRHAINMKQVFNNAGFKCGLVNMLFAETISDIDRYECAINAFPIQGNGIAYYSPSIRCFLKREPYLNESLGGIYLKKIDIIW